jgi:hypothetical protein
MELEEEAAPLDQSQESSEVKKSKKWKFWNRKGKKK